MGRLRSVTPFDHIFVKEDNYGNILRQAKSRFGQQGKDFGEQKGIL
jgi:hypothetical protein